MTHDLWAVLADGTMARIGRSEDFVSMAEAWKLADDRRLAGIVPEVRYLAIRSSEDSEWQARYRHVASDRLSVLRTREGSRVRVRIYGNDYVGRVVRSGLKTADVEFSTNAGLRVRQFRILPRTATERGIHKVYA